MNKLVQRIEVLEGANGAEIPSVILFRVVGPEGGRQMITIEGPDGHIVGREPEESEEAFEARAIAVFKQRTKDAAQRCITLIADCGHFDAAPRKGENRYALEISAPWLNTKQIRARN